MNYNDPFSVRVFSGFCGFPPQLKLVFFLTVLQRYIAKSAQFILLLLLPPCLPFLTSSCHILFSSSGQYNLILQSPQQL